MTDWHRQRSNPIELLKKLGWPHEHIIYDPKLRKGDYSIIRGSTHDGTFLFTHELIRDVLLPVAARISYAKSRKDEFDPTTVRYVVGPLKIATVHGMVKLPCSETMKYPGERQRVRMAVRMVSTTSQ